MLSKATYNKLSESVRTVVTYSEARQALSSMMNVEPVTSIIHLDKMMAIAVIDELWNTQYGQAVMLPYVEAIAWVRRWCDDYVVNVYRDGGEVDFYHRETGDVITVKGHGLDIRLTVMTPHSAMNDTFHFCWNGTMRDFKDVIALNRKLWGVDGMKKPTLSRESYQNDYRLRSLVGYDSAVSIADDVVHGRAVTGLAVYDWFMAKKVLDNVCRVLQLSSLDSRYFDAVRYVDAQCPRFKVRVYREGAEVSYDNRQIGDTVTIYGYGTSWRLTVDGMTSLTGHVEVEYDGTVENLVDVWDKTVDG